MEERKKGLRYFKYLSCKEEDTQVIISKLFIGGLIYIVSKFILPGLIDLIGIYNYSNSAISLLAYSYYFIGLIKFIGLIIMFIVGCNISYKLLKLIDLLIKNNKGRLYGNQK